MKSGTTIKILLPLEREELLKTNAGHKDEEFLQMTEQRQAILVSVTLCVTVNETLLEIYYSL